MSQEGQEGQAETGADPDRNGEYLQVPLLRLRTVASRGGWPRGSGATLRQSTARAQTPNS